MKKITLLFTILFTLSGCTQIDKYIKKITHKPSVLIGYQTYELREDIPPLVEVVFGLNDATVNDSAIDEIESKLTKNSYYLVEATAGGFTNDAQSLADRRVHEIITVLESYGIKSSNIFVTQYKAAKQGRRGYIYSISFVTDH